MIDLHGYIDPATIAHDTSGFGPFGADHGFITITPQLDEPGLPRWNFAQNSADVDYLSALLAHVQSTMCTDVRRMYVTGMSMGAFTASSLVEAVIVGVPDEKWGEQIGAVLRAEDPDNPPDVADLKLWCRERIAAHKTPALWYFTTELPMTPSGKIQKFRVQDDIASQRLVPASSLTPVTD
ncbi:AMP-binding enzyme [Nocardia mikamii]|uniref:AMP-binding enzyme n=1 Tax=Nocardia mikamii TaxID=508464 RepID=UPI001FDF7445|nr:hypothetical protein [Nocardia mikamii]